MKKLLVFLAIIGLMGGFVPKAQADVMRHDRGAVIIDNKGTIYFVGAETLYPFPSMTVFKSYGHELSDVQVANAADLALKVGPVPTLNQRPFGHVDSISSDGTIKGWVVDRDDLTSGSFTLWIYFDGPYPGDPGKTASINLVMATTRPDVNEALGLSGKFGFEASVPADSMDGLHHDIYVYAVDKESGDKPVLLIGSPKAFKFQQTQADLFSGFEELFAEEFTDDMAGRDKRRLWDVFSMLIGLLGYSEANNENFPNSLHELVPTYMTAVMTAPTPPDGNCSVNDNNYVYTPSADRKSFTLKYCFGAIPEGISSDYSSEYVISPFQAGVNVFDYGYYLAELEKAEAIATDARRVSEVLQIRVALELSYDSANAYPTSLSSLTPHIMSAIPTAPTPAGGSCTENQNTYSYTQLNNGQSYQLTFCLGGNISGYLAGVRTLTPSGIQ